MMMTGDEADLEAEAQGADQGPAVRMRGENPAPEAHTRGGGLEAVVVGHTPDLGLGHMKDEGRGHVVAHHHSHLDETNLLLRADQGPLSEIDEDQRTISLSWPTVHTLIRLNIQEQTEHRH